MSNRVCILYIEKCHCCIHYKTHPHEPAFCNASNIISHRQEFPEDGGIPKWCPCVADHWTLVEPIGERLRKIICPMQADPDACHGIKGFADECGKLHGKGFLGIEVSQCNNRFDKKLCWTRFYTSLGELL